MNECQRFRGLFGSKLPDRFAIAIPLQSNLQALRLESRGFRVREDKIQLHAARGCAFRASVRSPCRRT